MSQEFDFDKQFTRKNRRLLVKKFSHELELTPFENLAEAGDIVTGRLKALIPDLPEIFHPNPKAYQEMVNWFLIHARTAVRRSYFNIEYEESLTGGEWERTTENGESLALHFPDKRKDWRKFNDREEDWIWNGLSADLVKLYHHRKVTWGSFIFDRHEAFLKHAKRMLIIDPERFAQLKTNLVADEKTKDVFSRKTLNALFLNWLKAPREITDQKSFYSHLLSEASFYADSRLVFPEDFNRYNIYYELDELASQSKKPSLRFLSDGYRNLLDEAFWFDQSLVLEHLRELKNGWYFMPSHFFNLKVLTSKEVKFTNQGVQFVKE